MKVMRFVTKRCDMRTVLDYFFFRKLNGWKGFTLSKKKQNDTGNGIYVRACQKYRNTN